MQDKGKSLFNDNQIFTERIEVLNRPEDGVIIGKSVNYKFCTQAKSMEELEVKLKAMMRSQINYMQQILESDKPFEYRESNNLVSWLENLEMKFPRENVNKQK
jgi:hypothetical protein